MEDAVHRIKSHGPFSVSEFPPFPFHCQVTIPNRSSDITNCCRTACIEVLHCRLCTCVQKIISVASTQHHWPFNFQSPHPLPRGDHPGPRLPRPRHLSHGDLALQVWPAGGRRMPGGHACRASARRVQGKIQVSSNSQKLLKMRWQLLQIRSCY